MIRATKHITGLAKDAAPKDGDAPVPLSQTTTGWRTRPELFLKNRSLPAGVLDMSVIGFSQNSVRPVVSTIISPSMSKKRS